MISTVLIDYAGEPVAKGRPSFVSIGKKPRAFTPARTRTYEAGLKYAAQQVMGDRPMLVGPLAMSVTVELPIPRSWSKRKQREALLGLLAPVKRPDLDNYIKIACDALNCVVFADDSQITEFHRVRKVYSDRPSLRIEVMPARDVFARPASMEAA